MLHTHLQATRTDIQTMSWLKAADNMINEHTLFDCHFNPMKAMITVHIDLDLGMNPTDFEMRLADLTEQLQFLAKCAGIELHDVDCMSRRH